MTFRDERGVALLMVLLVISLLTAVIVDFSFQTRLDARIAANVRDDLRAETLARSGFQMALAVLNKDALEADESTAATVTGQGAVSELLNQARRQGARGEGPVQVSVGVDSLMDPWARMNFLRLPLGQGESLDVEVTDLAGLIDLNAIITTNTAGQPSVNQPVFDEIVMLITAAREAQKLRKEDGGGEEMSPEEIAYAIADWIDPDEVRIADGGFEDEFYNSLHDPYSTKNGPFDSVAELQLVAGMDDRLHEAIRKYLTVYPWTGGGAINPNTAPEGILATIRVRENAAIEAPEPLTMDQVQAILEARDQGTVLGSDQDVKELLDLDVAAVFSPSLVYGSNFFQIEASATVNGTLSRLHAVVDRGGEKPSLLYWRID
jgi:general secretion pathway protein K